MARREGPQHGRWLEKMRRAGRRRGRCAADSGERKASSRGRAMRKGEARRARPRTRDRAALEERRFNTPSAISRSGLKPRASSGHPGTVGSKTR